MRILKIKAIVVDESGNELGMAELPLTSVDARLVAAGDEETFVELSDIIIDACADAVKKF